MGYNRSQHVFFAAAAERGSQAPEEEESPNYEEKAHEIVQSILQEVVSTVAGGELLQSWLVDFCPGAVIVIMILINSSPLSVLESCCI